ncbi:MAG: class I SAM-dependent methyltransferase [Streptosporangiaceae bacterium]
MKAPDIPQDSPEKLVHARSTVLPGREPGGINYERMYAWRFHDVDQDRRQAVWQEIARYIHHRMGAPSCVLDPAAGRGEFINAVPAAERWGVDLVGQGVPESAGVKMIITDIMAADIPSDYFDGVFVSNFLEHLPDQNAVATVLGKLYGSLQPGGRIAIIGPNFRYCAREYFDCADHTVILSHIAVTEHLYAAGFDVTAVSARFLPFSFRGLLPPSPRLTRFYLRTPVLWRLLGKQFLVLARKPPVKSAE